MPDLIAIPQTPAEFRSPRPSSEVAEMATLQRNPEHWAEILPILKVLAGEAESIHGSPKLDEAGLIFAVQKICEKNGYTLLAEAKAARIGKLFKHAYRRNTGQTVAMLMKQGTRRRIEHRRHQRPL